MRHFFSSHRLLAGVLISTFSVGTAVAQSNSSNEPRSFWKIYGENIEYQTYSTLDFDDLSVTPVALPRNYKDNTKAQMGLDKFTPELTQKFEEKIIAQLQANHMTAADIANLKPKEALDLSIKIIMDQMENDPEMDKKEYQQQQDIENSENPRIARMSTPDLYFYPQCFVDGKGDCDKYVDSLRYVFEWMKKKNPKLANIHITSRKFGGSSMNASADRHDWNSILIMYPDKLIVSHVDLWTSDEFNDENVEAAPGKYVPRSELLFKALFYYQTEKNLGGYQFFLKYPEEILHDLYEESYPNEKKWRVRDYLFDLSYVPSSKGDDVTMKFFVNLYTKQNLDITQDLEFLYRVYQTLKGEDNKPFRDIIVTKYPQSYQATSILEYEAQEARNKK